MDHTESCIAANAKGNSDVIAREYLDSLAFKQRLIGSGTPSIKTTLWGHELGTPIMTAAMSGLMRFREDGTECMAGAMKQMDSVMWMGISENEDVEKATATGARVIEIIKPYADRELFIKKMEHAKACGCIAVGTDIDHCFAKDGTCATDRPGNQLRAMDIEDLKELKERAHLPFIVKGILSVEDALSCVEAGVDGIVLSNHHNIFPFAIPPVMILPEIRKAVGNQITIIVDGMLRDGYDAMKALALGADGVCVGRALQKPLTDQGTEGVSSYINEMNHQLAGIMARCKVLSMKEMTPDVIVKLR